MVRTQVVRRGIVASAAVLLLALAAGGCSSDDADGAKPTAKQPKAKLNAAPADQGGAPSVAAGGASPAAAPRAAPWCAGA